MARAQSLASHQSSRPSTKAKSLPSLRSPLEAPQTLCTVQVRKRRVERTAIGEGSVKQITDRRLAFTSFGRGLEWERPGREGFQELPPLPEVMRRAMKEFNLRPASKSKSPPKKNGLRAPKAPAAVIPEVKSSPVVKKNVEPFTPYVGGPRLPMHGRSIEHLLPPSFMMVEVVRPTSPFLEDIDTALPALPEEVPDHRASTAVAQDTRRTLTESKLRPVPRPSVQDSKRQSVLEMKRHSVMDSAQAKRQSMMEQKRGTVMELKRGTIARNSPLASARSQPVVEEAAATPSSSSTPLPALAQDDLPFPWMEDELRSAFSRFDTDRDGELHTEELQQLLQYLGARPQTGDVEQIVKEQTRYSTLSYEEVVEFVHRFRKLDIKRMYEQFVAADKDGSGALDFDELHELLLELGYSPTTQSTLEAFEALDKDKSSTIMFREFEGLREYLRVTEGFTRADCEEMTMLHAKSNLPREDPADIAEETFRITMYLGYSAPIDLIERLCDQVNPERQSGMTLNELLKVVRLVRETELTDMVRTFAEHGSDPNQLPCEDLGIALTDLGYHVSEDAVNEILESLGECEKEETLTFEEFGAFMRAYRRTEGFTQAELAELREVFVHYGRLEEGALHTLELGKVLRWFGFARTVQQVQQLVEEIDLDGSGVLEFTEFVKLMRKLYQEEAERRQQVFMELATESQTGALEVHVDRFSDAVAMLAGVEPDPEMVEAAAKSSLAELHSRRPSREGEGRPVAEVTERPRTVFVSKTGFEAFFRHYRRYMIDEIRKSAGYTLLEKAQLQDVFDMYDEDKSGTIERGELIQLLSNYFPDSTKSREGQKDVKKALEEADADGNGTLDFNEFLFLMRKCDDARDSRDMQQEVEVIKELGFPREEVDGFRQIFSAYVDWKGEIDLPTLAGILNEVVELSETELLSLSLFMCDVHPQRREAARFPQFLRLMRRLTKENFGNLNRQAERLRIKRLQEQELIEQRKQRMAQEMRETRRTSIVDELLWQHRRGSLSSSPAKQRKVSFI